MTQKNLACRVFFSRVAYFPRGRLLYLIQVRNGSHALRYTGIYANLLEISSRQPSWEQRRNYKPACLAALDNSQVLVNFLQHWIVIHS